MPSTIFENFEGRQRQLWGYQTVLLKHSLARSELFTDEGIAELIDSLPQDRVAFNTMASDGHHLHTWGYCDRGGHKAKDILDIVRTGRLWINMTRLETVDRRFAELVDQIFAELEGKMPGLKTFKRSIGLLVSSPNAQVFYHADVPGQMLWQLRGSKRIYIYPPELPFLQPREIENVVRAVTEEEITYSPWYDEYAEVHDLGPGDVLHWKLNGPHRVVNLNSVNVSLTTEHWTDGVRRSYAMNYGNGILRGMGLQPKSRSLIGPAFWSKVALTMAWRASGLHRQTSFKRRFAYRIDPSREGGLLAVEQA